MLVWWWCWWVLVVGVVLGVLVVGLLVLCGLLGCAVVAAGGIVGWVVAGVTMDPTWAVALGFETPL
ncbi:hypothetical protein RA281_27480, partial [Pseudomonas syringae pv. tagetis]